MGLRSACVEAILERWRTQDDEELRELLLAACDRHTHESKFDTETEFYDFGDELLSHTPLEIFMVLRLRAWSGLTTPLIEHPLMEAPFDRLPEPVPVPPPDDLMIATLARAGKEWPQLRATTLLENVKKWAHTSRRV